jgi:prepilin-type N-terminal cleavage/methylation domain-containing protein
VNRLEGDRGLTVVEVMVVLSISAITGLALLSTVTSTANLEHAISDRTEAQFDLNQALGAVASDVRSSTPTVSLLTSSPGETLALETEEPPGTAVVVHWVVDGADLDRIVINAATLAITSQTTVFSSLAPTTEPAFRYFDAGGALVDSGLSATARAACTTRIRVTLGFDAGTSTRSDQVDVAVRSRTPGDDPC